MAKPSAHPHSGLPVEDPIFDSLGDLVAIVRRKDQRIEVEAVVADQSRYE
jgi:hypothetical protein